MGLKERDVCFSWGTAKGNYSTQDFCQKVDFRTKPKYKSNPTELKIYILHTSVSLGLLKALIHS